MKEFKGTKGEWVATGDGIHSTDTNVLGNIVCGSPSIYYSSMEYWEANAKIIVAAPDMLKILFNIYNKNGCYSRDEIERLLTKILD